MNAEALQRIQGHRERIRGKEAQQTELDFLFRHLQSCPVGLSEDLILKNQGHWGVEEITGRKWVSNTGLISASGVLASKLSGKVDSVIGVARSGMVPATIVAMALHLPLYILRESEEDVIHAGHGWRMNTNELLNPVVIDDTSCSGASLEHVKSIINRQKIKAQYAVVYYDPASTQQVDHCSYLLKSPHVLEWNIANSVYSSTTVWDIDGLICEDCPGASVDDISEDSYLQWLRSAPPKCLPKRSPITIATGRREKWREETLKWMDRHGVKVRDLHMHPDGERTGQSVIAHKAKVVSEFSRGLVGMLESDRRQAVEIEKITGKSAYYVE